MALIRTKQCHSFVISCDFSKAPGSQDFSKLKSPYALFVDALGSKQVFQYVYHMRLCITVSIVTDNIVYVVSF